MTAQKGQQQQTPKTRTSRVATTANTKTLTFGIHT